MGLKRSPLKRGGSGLAHDPRGSSEALGATYSVSKELDETGKCGGCDREVKGEQKGIGCDVCGEWYHSKCVGMNDKVYKFYAEADGGATWICGGCKTRIKDGETTIKELRKENNRLRDENREIRQDLERIVGRLEGLKDEIKRELKEELKEELRGNIGRDMINGIQGRVVEGMVGQVEDKMRDREEKVKRESRVSTR